MQRRSEHLALLVFSLLLAACQSLPGKLGPRVPADTPGAGRLTLPGNNTYWIMPDALQFSGNATYQWPSGRRYTGEFVEGKAEGTGLSTGPGEQSYQGQWLAGQYHGHGELNDLAGNHYLGNFVTGQRSGSGTETSADGLYKGLWLNDLPHGQGEFRGSKGERYDGSYEAGLRQGVGDFVGSDGSRYSGEWQQDAPHGFGELTSATGTSYIGQLHQGRQQGYGTQKDRLGNHYAGTWHAGKYQGYGEIKRADGSSYKGYWLQGKRSGQGVEIFAAGGSHDGEWEANQSQGPGTRVTPSGVRISGMFLGDSLSTGILTLDDGSEYGGRLFRKRTSEVDSKLVRWTEAQATRGNTQAQFLMGTFYSNFNKPKPNTKTAARWYAGAANEYPEAAFRLGQLLLVDQPQRAVAYLQQAAEQQHTGAHLQLGELFHSGRVVSPDATKAQHHYQQALNLGNFAARNPLAWLLATSQEAHVRDPERAITLIEPFAKASENWEILDTLAAGYAAASRFEEAVATQSAALAQLSDEQEDQRSALADRLRRYQRGEPFIEILELAE